MTLLQTISNDEVIQMVRGTTPTYTLEMDGYDLTQMTVIVIVRGQYGATITKTGDQLIVAADKSGSTIVFKMTQEETLSLTEGKANVQVRFIDSQGMAYATNIADIEVKPVLLGGVIEYE